MASPEFLHPIWGGMGYARLCAVKGKSKAWPLTSSNYPPDGDMDIYANSCPLSMQKTEWRRTNWEADSGFTKKNDA